MKTVYLIVCGAGQAARAHEFIEAARTAGWDCHVIATNMGAKFIAKAQLEAASGHPVTAEHRQPGTPRRDRPDADAVVIAPGAANTIGKLAAGIADVYALDIASEYIGLFLLFDGRVEEAKLRAWVAVRPQPERLFRTYTG